MAFYLQNLSEKLVDAATFALPDKTRIVIGREGEKDIKVVHSSVSRTHCVLENHEGAWRVRDEGSHNGTFVNGVKVTEAWREMKQGDKLRLGEVELRLMTEEKQAKVKAPSVEKKEDKAVSPSPSPRKVSPVPSPSAKESAKSPAPKTAASTGGSKTVRLIVAASVLFVLVLAGGLGARDWGKYERIRQLTGPLPSGFAAPKEPVDVFRIPGRKGKFLLKISFGELTGLESEAIAKDRPEPDRNSNGQFDVRSNKTPRLFDGMDLDLIGGEQALLSNYFFLRKAYTVRDYFDPTSYVRCEIEGWRGLGKRYANPAVLPAIRRGELPHYSPLPLVPNQIQSGKIETEPDAKGAESASLSWMHGGKYPCEGRYFSFYRNGDRFEVVVRGTTNAMRRVSGGVDALAKTFLQTLKFETGEEEARAPTTEDLEKEIAGTLGFMEALAIKPALMPNTTHQQLRKCRELLANCQKFEKPLKGEERLRTLYFQIVRDLQQELVKSALKIEGEGNSKSDERVKELERLKSFLGEDFPSTNTKPTDPAYPEWAMYYDQQAETLLKRKKS